MGVSLAFQIASSHDLDHLVGMAIAFRNHLERGAPTDEQFRDSISRLLASDDAEFCLALADQQPIGYVLQRFRFSMWAGGLEATLEDLFIAPAQRQKGIGKQLIEFAVARAQTKGCLSVCLDTNENNVASTKIYTDLGFNALDP